MGRGWHDGGPRETLYHREAPCESPPFRHGASHSRHHAHDPPSCPRRNAHDRVERVRDSCPGCVVYLGRDDLGGGFVIGFDCGCDDGPGGRRGVRPLDVGAGGRSGVYWQRLTVWRETLGKMSVPLVDQSCVINRRCS